MCDFANVWPNMCCRTGWKVRWALQDQIHTVPTRNNIFNKKENISSFGALFTDFTVGYIAWPCFLLKQQQHRRSTMSLRFKTYIYTIITPKGLHTHNTQINTLEPCISLRLSATLCPYPSFGCRRAKWKPNAVDKQRKTKKHSSTCFNIYLCARVFCAFHTP